MLTREKPPPPPRFKIGDWVEITNQNQSAQPPLRAIIGEQGFIISSPYTAHQLNKTKDAWNTFWVLDVEVVRIHRGIGLRLTKRSFRVPATALKKLTHDPDAPKPKNVNPYHTKTLTKQQYAKLWELRFDYLGRNGARRNRVGVSYLNQILEQNCPPLMNPPTAEIANAIREIIHPCICIRKKKPLDFNCPFHGPDLKALSKGIPKRSSKAANSLRHRRIGRNNQKVRKLG